jgi:hypothetical protein
MAGRLGEVSEVKPRCLEHASLREDYLNQVQRDFLSRRLRGNTPSECPLWRGEGIVRRRLRRLPGAQQAHEKAR